MENIYDTANNPLFVSTVIYYDISGLAFYTDVAVFDVSGAAAYIPLDHNIDISGIRVHTNMDTWSREMRVCDHERNMCPISFETIRDNAEYCMCGGCHQPFLPQMLQTALRRSYTCPYCRAPWTQKVIYTNGTATV
jgi:hypothetical protein